MQLVYEADGTGVPTEARRRTATNCGLLNVRRELLVEVLGHDVQQHPPPRAERNTSQSVSQSVSHSTYLSLIHI